MPHKALPAGCPHAEAGVRILKLHPIAQEQAHPTAPRMAKVHPAEPIVVRLVRWRRPRHVQPLVARIARNESTVEDALQLAVDGSGHLVANSTRQDPTPASPPGVARKTQPCTPSLLHLPT